MSRHTRAARRSGRLTIGRHTYGMPILEDYEGSFAEVHIGDFCSIGPGVKVMTGGNHPLGWVSTYPFRIKILNDRSYQDGMPYTKGDIEIGSDVWIGGHATIMSGVRVGHGAVIASGAIVTKDVEPYAVVGGVPSKLIRKRFDDATIERLLATKWWERDDATIKKLIPLLSSSDVDAFVNALK